MTEKLIHLHDQKGENFFSYRSTQKIRISIAFQCTICDSHSREQSVTNHTIIR